MTLTLLKTHSITVNRIASVTPTWANGYQNMPTPSVVAVTASIQPTMDSGTVKELSNREVPGVFGDRITDGCLVYTKDPMYLKDTFSFGGKTYEVYQVDNWTGYAGLSTTHYRAMCRAQEPV